MIDADYRRFTDLVASVFAFYRRDFSEFAGTVWWQAMRPFDLAAVQDAMNRHCVNPDTGQFMPMPADIVRMLNGTSMDASMVAWSAVDRALREIGTYRSVTFDDPITMRALQDMGGWIPLGTKKEDEWPFVGNEFRNRYKGYHSRLESPECPPHLPGILEAENGLLSQATHVLIGDRQAAQAIAKGRPRQALTVTTAGVAAKQELIEG